jgi:peptidoglycan/xylan/chitin deacetylase (PgdA/CDA1 family)
VYALTFDDGPSPNSNALMDILASNGVKASFFLVGTQVEQFPAQINREVRGCQRAGSWLWACGGVWCVVCGVWCVV